MVAVWTVAVVNGGHPPYSTAGAGARGNSQGAGAWRRSGLVPGTPPRHSGRMTVTPILTDPAAYRFWTEERVRFADLDALGHVNNNAIGVYFESGRVSLMEACGRFGTGSTWSVVLARSVTEFKAELLYPATARIGLRVLRLGNSSLTLGIAIFRDDTCIATQEAVCVIVDAVTHRPMPLPADLRTALGTYLDPA